MFEARFQSFEDRAERAASGPRLAALRTELARRGLTGFIVPRSEPPSERIRAGVRAAARLADRLFGLRRIAIVLMERALLFVDGRYTLQAREQVGVPRCSPSSTWWRRPRTGGSRRISRPAIGSVTTPCCILSRVRSELGKACAAAGANAGRGRARLDRRHLGRSPRAAHRAVTLHDIRLRRGSRRGQARAHPRRDAKAARRRAGRVGPPRGSAWAFNIRGADVAHTPLPLAFAVVPQAGRPSLYVDGRKLSNKVRNRLEALADVPRAVRFRRLARSARPAKQTMRLDQATAADRALRSSSPATAARSRAGRARSRGMKAVKNEIEIAGARAAHIRDGAAVTRFLAWFDREAPRGKLTEIDAVAALESFRRDTGLLRTFPFRPSPARVPTARSYITASPAGAIASLRRVSCF